MKSPFEVIAQELEKPLLFPFSRDERGVKEKKQIKDKGPGTAWLAGDELITSYASYRNANYLGYFLSQ